MIFLPYLLNKILFLLLFLLYYINFMDILPGIEYQYQCKIQKLKTLLITKLLGLILIIIFFPLFLFLIPVSDQKFSRTLFILFLGPWYHIFRFLFLQYFEGTFLGVAYLLILFFHFNYFFELLFIMIKFNRFFFIIQPFLIQVQLSLFIIGHYVSFFLELSFSF